ncbi:MAG: SLBB domain-containing protein [Bacteroidaceae bacterium]|nr:SLBB domain-containing protein [Bacteroidaceae bacterium]
MRKYLLALALSLSAVCAYSQSMTDDQVIQFVQKEQAAGQNQQSIVSKLLRKGVTPEQLRRIRRKVEAEQNQPGALDLTGKSKNQTENRLRTNKEKAEDLYRQKNGYMVRSQREQAEQRYMTRKDRQDALNEEIGFLDIDSLAYYQSMFEQDDENQVFGRNIFNNEYLTFEPNQNMATPANYRLGAGDNVVIDVWGASQETFEGTISPDGYIVIEGVGPIRLGGLSVSQATATVKSRLGQFYSGCSFNLAVGETRSIQVQVVGEVRMPGTYTLSSFSSAFNALYAAGGINDIGTLRDIKVYRSGRQIATIDVYDYLLNGNSKGDVRLQDNDIVAVGAYECLVAVRGKVKRPMFYEMKRSESVLQLIRDAGGFTGDAYTKNVRLTRKAGNEYSMHTVDEFKMSGFTLMDGDSVYVDSVIPRFSNMVEVRGAVRHEGKYELGGDVQTVKGLLLVAEGLREDAYQSRAVMHREKDDLSLEMVSVDIEGILDGTVADIPLKKGDVLFVPSTIDMKGEQILTIRGEVVFPGDYQYAENTNVEDLILMAGGLTPAASMAKVDVYRRVQNEKATEATELSSEVFSFALNDGLRSGDTSFGLMPYDIVVVRKSPAYNEQQTVRVEGCVNFEGEYAMSTKNYRLSDLVRAAGGLTNLGYAKGARLTRQMTEEEKIQRENSLRAAQIQMYEEAMQSEKRYDMAQADSLMSLKLDMGETYPLSINLQEAIDNPSSAADIVLREGDLLTIPQYSNTVKVSGEVLYPVSMGYMKNKSLKYYIKRAGGYGNRANKKGAYAIYMNGSAEKINRHSWGGKDIEPGCEIVIPTKKQKSRMTTGEIAAISTGSASLASVVVALVSILKKN